MSKVVTINGEKCFVSFQDAADFLGCSLQTIRRYTSQRQRQDRRLRLVYYSSMVGWLLSGYYLPYSEVVRFRDEIRPTLKYGGRYGRPKGAKDKKPRKKKEADILPPPTSP